MLAFCGLNCAECDIYKAGKGDTESMQRVLNWFKEEAQRIIKSEQVKCGGCKGDLESHWSPKCEILSCARQKDVEECYNCADFICYKLVAFENDGSDRHRIAVERLKNIKKIGYGEWLKSQR